MPKLETPNLDRALKDPDVNLMIKNYCRSKSDGMKSIMKKATIELFEDRYPMSLNKDMMKISSELKNKEYFCRKTSSDSKKLNLCLSRATIIDPIIKWHDYGCTAEHIYLFFDFK